MLNHDYLRTHERDLAPNGVETFAGRSGLRALEVPNGVRALEGPHGVSAL